MVNLGSASLDTRLRMIEQIFDNMGIKTGTGMLLAGSTGIGKTTMIKQLGKLLGINVVLIEAPHVTEEHLINIPFITFAPNGTKKPDMARIDMDNVNVTLAQSHLATTLRSSKPIADSQYLANVRGFDNNTRTLYQRLGGDESTVPQEIADLRRRYRTVLFLDEYWREVSANVRNILRGILNGRIGNDRIPPGTYVVYASNISDVGQTIENIPMNADFKMLDFKAPSKDDFFHYVIASAEERGIKLEPKLINAFHAALDDNHISYDDVEKNIRTSPRRWEQILLYINAALPIDTRDKARQLLANVEANFRSEEETSDLHKLVDSIVRDVIDKTGGTAFKDEKALGAGDWRQTLQHQIEMKIKMGDSRTYVPVVMGQPGIGKTSQMHEIADNLNLLPIVISTDTVSADDVTGVPLPKREVDEAEDSGERFGVSFSEPPLYKKIMQDAREEEDAFMSDPAVPQERKDRWRKQKVKYLLFFDELNRVRTQNVFNSLRRVILDKSFNDQVHLPDSIIIVAAMNPNDKGTAELTGHLKDAIDLIDAAPSWDQLKAYLNNPKGADRSMGIEKLPDAARQMARKILDQFAMDLTMKRPKGKITRDMMKFYIKIGDQEPMYISMREYSTLYAEMAKGIARELGRLSKDPSRHEEQLYRAVMTKLESTLSWIMHKHQMESRQFLKQVADWLASQMPKFLIKQRSAVSFEAMMDEVLADRSQHLKDNPNFVNYAKNFNRNKFTEDVQNYFDKLVESEKNKYDIWAKEQVNAKKIEDGKMVVANELWTKLEALNNELYAAHDAYELSNDLVDAFDREIITALTKISEEVSLPEDKAMDLLRKGIEMLQRLRMTT